FVASVAHKTREQQVKFGGIYGSDTQAVADSRVGGRSAPLTEDVPLASETHQIIDGKEIRRIVLPTDEFQLHCQGGAHLFGQRIAETFASPLPGEVFQFFHRAPPLADNLLGIDILELIQRKTASISQRQAMGKGFWILPKKAVHLLHRLEVAFSISMEPESSVMDGTFLSDTGQHILQLPPPGIVVMHIVERDKRDIQPVADLRQTVQLLLVVTAIEESST